MPDISDLNLNTDDEVVGEINWDAPEQGTFQPRLQPGQDYTFIFELEDIPFPEREYEGKVIREVAFKATTTITSESGEDQEVTIRFQRADFFQTPKMLEKRMNSRGGELMRSLGLRVDRMSWDAIKQAFKEADGKTRFTATVGWVAYSKADKVNIRTHNPRKKDIPWPRGADGKYDQPVHFPSGDTSYGREEVARFRVKKEG